MVDLGSIVNYILLSKIYLIDKLITFHFQWNALHVFLLVFRFFWFSLKMLHQMKMTWLLHSSVAYVLKVYLTQIGDENQVHFSLLDDAELGKTFLVLSIEVLYRHLNLRSLNLSLCHPKVAHLQKIHRLLIGYRHPSKRYARSNIRFSY